MQLHASQINRLDDAFVGILNFTASGTSINVTSVITTALGSAGDGGVSVPLQVATSTAIGVVTGVNLPVFANSTKKRIASGTGSEVYGRITEAAGVYTLSFYSNEAGTETAYNLASTAIDFYFVYRFDFYRKPKTSGVSLALADINESIASPSTGKTFIEALTVTATNTISNLTKTPTANNQVMLFVNGKAEYSSDSAFSISGKAITWSAASAGYSVLTGFTVVASYLTLE